MPIIAISGAGSGIGHTFLTHFAADQENTIHAIDVAFRDEASAHDSIRAKITRHECNTSSPDAVQKLVSSLDTSMIDLFIHCAAVRGLVPSATKTSENPSDAETMEIMDVETFSKTLQVNIIGSFLLIRALVPKLKAASAAHPDKPAKCVVMSSRMGSIASNNGGAYAYRASKAGLNAVVKSFSVDVPDVVFTIMHPGRVESRMTHVREEGAVDAPDAVREMVPVIQGLGKAESGMFLLKDGSEIPW